jgi:hypothetical protein
MADTWVSEKHLLEAWEDWKESIVQKRPADLRYRPAEIQAGILLHVYQRAELAWEVVAARKHKNNHFWVGVCRLLEEAAKAKGASV